MKFACLWRFKVADWNFNYIRHNLPSAEETGATEKLVLNLTIDKLRHLTQLHPSALGG